MAGRGKATRRTTKTRPRAVDRAPSRRRLPFVIASCALVAPLVLGVVTVQTLVSQNAFRVRELSRQTVALQQSYKELKLEVAQLSSPRRIAREARRQGLQLPEDVYMLPVRGAPETAGGDPAPSFALKSFVEERP
jgi:cell division protein FtsL